MKEESIMMKRNLCVPVIGVCCAMFCMLLLSACSKTEPSGADAVSCYTHCMRIETFGIWASDCIFT